MFSEYYKGKKVLVTGHTGFKGSWLALWLIKLGANVIGYSLDPYTERDHFITANLSERIIDVRGDIKDSAKLSNVFETYKPDIVFHLAAQPLVRLSFDIPRQTFEDNIMGTVNLLECVRMSSSVKSCICITSDKCYDNKEWVWGYRETDPMGGFDPYSASKGCSELVVSSYINSFFNPEQYNFHGKVIASVRAGNVIGGGDWSKDRIIPDIIRAVEQNIPIEVRSPLSIRPWQHVLEPLSGYMWLCSQLHEEPHKYSGGWNFGPENDSIITVQEIVNQMIENLGQGSWSDCSNPNDIHEAKLLNLDCSKANFILKWNPTLKIEECIHLTADWYKRYYSTDGFLLSSDQIDYYVEQATKDGNRWAK